MNVLNDSDKDQSKSVSDSDLCQFTGTSSYTRWSMLFPRHVITDGVKYLAEKASAFWLLDAIASYHRKLIKAAQEDSRLGQFQIWCLNKNPKGGVILTCKADSNEKPVVRQVITFSDFFENYSGEELKLFVIPQEFSTGTKNVILLPSEY